MMNKNLLSISEPPCTGSGVGSNEHENNDPRQEKQCLMIQTGI